MVSREPIKTLERRVYLSYRARLRASKRLAARQAVWSTTLTVASTTLLIVSVAQLAFGSPSTRDAVLVVAVSAVLLSVTLVITSLRYASRAERLSVNYRALQSLSTEIEAARHRLWVGSRAYEEWLARYNALLDASENHTWADHIGSEPKTTREFLAVVGSNIATYWPLAGVVVALSVLAAVFWPQ